MHILSNSTKFSAGQPLLSAHNFSVTMAASTTSTYCSGCGLPKNCQRLKIYLQFRQSCVLFTNIKFRSQCPFAFKYNWKHKWLQTITDLQKNAYFVHQGKIFCWSAPTSRVQFFSHNGLYLYQLSSACCGLSKIVEIENMPQITVQVCIVNKW